jgi:hypothetical protein
VNYYTSDKAYVVGTLQANKSDVIFHVRKSYPGAKYNWSIGVKCDKRPSTYVTSTGLYIKTTTLSANRSYKLQDFCKKIGLGNVKGGVIKIRWAK